MIQWTDGPMDRTLTQCSIAISRLDGIGMGYIMSTGIGFVSVRRRYRSDECDFLSESLSVLIDLPDVTLVRDDTCGRRH